MAQSTRSTPRLSPLDGKPILLGFDGADMSSDAGLMVLREIECKAGLALRLADCLSDRRDPAKVQHGLDDIIRFWIMMIAAGYEDGNDADDLRYDPGFKLVLERGPATAAALCSPPTISCLENLADPRHRCRQLPQIGRRGWTSDYLNLSGFSSQCSSTRLIQLSNQTHVCL